MPTYQLFNVFGMLRVERSHISGLASAVLPAGTSVEHTINEDLEKTIDIVPEGEVCVLLFTADVQPARKPRVAVQQISKRAGGPDVLGEPQVKAAIKKVIGMIEV